MEIENIAEEVRNCKKCWLWETRTNAVPGDGPETPEFLFIGEAPGSKEDIHGKPFVGAAGKVLDELLESAGFKREEVFITNIVKCRPPGNRNPLKHEIETCTPYLDRQILSLKPKVICTLGNFSTDYILTKYDLPSDKIGKVHGQLFQKEGVKIVPLYHPAAMIYNRKLKDVLLEDLRKLKENY